MKKLVKILPYKKIFLNACAAGLLYGTWAYVANDKGALVSAVTQGSMSFSFTFFVAFYLELVHRKASGFTALVLYCVSLIVFLTLMQMSIHYIVDTQNIIATILPSVVIGSIYILFYVLHLKKGMQG